MAYYFISPLFFFSFIFSIFTIPKNSRGKQNRTKSKQKHFPVVSKNVLCNLFKFSIFRIQKYHRICNCLYAKFRFQSQIFQNTKERTFQRNSARYKISCLNSFAKLFLSLLVKTTVNTSEIGLA